MGCPCGGAAPTSTPIAAFLIANSTPAMYDLINHIVWKEVRVRPMLRGIHTDALSIGWPAPPNRTTYQVLRPRVLATRRTSLPPQRSHATEPAVRLSRREGVRFRAGGRNMVSPEPGEGRTSCARGCEVHDYSIRQCALPPGVRRSSHEGRPAVDRIRRQEYRLLASREGSHAYCHPRHRHPACARCILGACTIFGPP